MSTPKPGSMNQRTLRRVGALALFTAPALGISLVPVFAGAQDPTRCGNAAVTSREVVSLKFDGNTVYNDAFLANSIITEPSSWWRRYLKFFGRRRCFDQKSFQDDALRLRKLYTTSGYSRVRVDTSVRAVGRNKVAVSFSLREGDPIIVDTLRFLGLDSLPERDAILKHLPILEHNPPRFDMYALQKSIDTITRRLRDAGFPSADVFQETHSDTATQRARIELDVQHGTRAKLRDIDIRITPISGDKPKISEGTVRGLLGIKPNDEYRESRLQRAKRNLYVTEAYRAVSVDVDSVDVIPPGDSLVTVHVSLAEGLMHSGRTSGGYGTIDCFRTEGEYRDNNFLHTAKRFELRARLTKIGIGSPLSGAESLCRWLRDDPYSTKLNYYFGTTFTNPSSVILGFQPSVTLYVERRSEYKAFLRSTLPGALLSGTRQTTRTKQTVGYQFEYRRTEAQPAIFCALQNLCLPEDREPLLAYHRLATVSWVGEQAWANDPQYPSQGGALRLELRHASTVTGSDHSLQFSKATADFSTFFSLGHGIVLAPRIRVGAVV
ncbi:MAG TPA: POTRA domain-containing protein, partial [Gemmatimonadaceae bacterium]|nr:POTRA domain-containing protein [Gemmatimonadaceae bacterium]